MVVAHGPISVDGMSVDLTRWACKVDLCGMSWSMLSERGRELVAEKRMLPSSVCFSETRDINIQILERRGKIFEIFVVECVRESFDVLKEDVK
jgi:hypothetical protein